jgi:hypothetical protein
MEHKCAQPKGELDDGEEVNTGSPKSGNGYGDGDSIVVNERMQLINEVGQPSTPMDPSSEST